ncbi:MULTISPECIES: acyl-CoA dehydrogenase family protein [unclassified Saccharibacter]|uniref:acyl-CoA dehydrogenase family protein n=1 Tax=unclassified Saccharibacter TaxID=2648722 RepID=UPI001329AE33|nr:MULTISPECIES: acyl-CoA dehydrogenase family protein [unclassified Saccharibacter]MXV35131.1 acyl-CoA dehydrogenase [Saccharibacter sp. EH611]MXV57322.1 acyl-CoA dehydrogenase [Saccharibacter sp. EH70]MXV64817.1 acyl-CoA dehydrogenase [Saccharibacter sp. EH60]
MSQLSDALLSLQGHAQSIRERASQYDQLGEIAQPTLDFLRHEGILSLAVPQEYGGAGIGFQDMTRIIASLAENDPSTALIVAMQYLHCFSIATSPSWPEDLKEEVLSDIKAHGSLVNALRVEPELGTPSRGGIPATRLRHVNGQWVLSGRKIFSTGSSALRWGLVWCATDENPQRVGQVLVRLDQEAIAVQKSWHHLGMRATGSDTIVFNDAPVPERYLANIVSTEEGNPETPGLFVWHALILAHLYNAIAHSARQWFTSFLHKRVPSGLGRPLATLPRFQTIVGEIDGLLLSNTALLNHAQTHYEAITLTEASQIKRLVTEQAISAVQRAIEVSGNPGLSQDNPLERHYRNVLCGRIHSPQADTVLEKAGFNALFPS